MPQETSGAESPERILALARRVLRIEAEAVEMMERHKINQLLVVGATGELKGALNMHDLFRAKVV